MNKQPKSIGYNARTLRTPVSSLRQRPFVKSTAIRTGLRRLPVITTFAAKGVKPTAAKGFGAPKPQTKGIASDAPCPCGSGSQYETCCAPYHRGAAAVPTPEALLRSRYSAYVAKDPQYIADTTHPDSEEHTGSRSSYLATIKSTMRRLDPLSLTILAAEPGASEDEAFMTFRLKRRIKDPEVPRNPAEVDELTERSRFLRVKGRWYYMDSVFIKEGEEAGAGPAGAAAGGQQQPAQAPAAELPKKKGFLGLF